MSRKYELRRRAERQDETRRRIVEAAFRLHCEVGPARASITAIAQEAGVERLTVYRHFPEMSLLFRECGAHAMRTFPPPDAESWRAEADPVPRLRRALRAIYAYYRTHERRLFLVIRDQDDGLRVGEARVAALRGAADVIAEVWPRRRLVRAAIAHSLDFQAWRSLAARQGLEDAEIVNLMTGLVESAAART
jgi:AcrR family transcriptional regulator